MTSVRKSRVAASAITAALGMFVGGVLPASAADLGGNCCADLEERIAELEATTARKGNRKVSLTISGWVNEELLFWDDGRERNAYIGTNSLEQSRFRFVGEAKIADDWSAGYTLEIGINTHPSSQWDQNSGGSSTSSNPTSQDNSLIVRKSNWWIKNKNLGTVAVGLNGSATYHLLDDADAANTRNFSDAEAAPVAMAQFQLLQAGASVNGLKWTDIMRGLQNSTPGQDGRKNVVRYDSPTIMGFVATAAWGEDDLWDVALTYANKLGDFKVIGKAGYGEGTDELATKCHSSGKQLDCQWWGVAGTVMHEPTGLYVYGAYGHQHDNRGTDPGITLGADESDSMWLVQGGIEQKFFALGKTTVFGEYRHDDAGSNVKADPGPGTFVRSSSLDFWAAGVVQNIDAAAMDLYLIYRHADGYLTSNTNVKIGLDAFDMVQAGAMIKF
jgi:predicted porin